MRPKLNRFTKLHILLQPWSSIDRFHIAVGPLNCVIIPPIIIILATLEIDYNYFNGDMLKKLLLQF